MRGLLLFYMSITHLTSGVGVAGPSWLSCPVHAAQVLTKALLAPLFFCLLRSLRAGRVGCAGG